MSAGRRDLALVLGEALVDVTQRGDAEPVAYPGGSPMNVAIGLARLGREARLAAWLTDDEYGTILTDHLDREGVDLVPGSLDAERSASAKATIGETGAATYDFDIEWDLPEIPREIADRAVVVHTGSIAAVLEPGASKVAAAVAEARENSTITYDPNIRPQLMGDPQSARPVVEALVAQADVVKTSDEDIEWLTGGQDLEEVMRHWLDLGTALVVVTRGGEGATALTATHGPHTVAPEKVDVADTVGAGDSFMSGLVDGLWGADLLGADRREALRAIDEETLRAILRRCAHISAMTVSRPGANPPTSAELGE